MHEFYRYGIINKIAKQHQRENITEYVVLFARIHFEVKQTKCVHARIRNGNHFRIFYRINVHYGDTPNSTESII